MPLILPGNVASATAVATYSIDNSCRWNDGDTPHMYKSFGTPTDGKKYTFSCWLKIGTPAPTSGTKHLWYFSESSTQTEGLQIETNGSLTHFFKLDDVITYSYTNRRLRDPSAWYHIVLAIDYSQSTDTNRVKLYINGVLQTSLQTGTYAAQNTLTKINKSGNSPAIGVTWNGSSAADAFDGYIAEVFFIDGLQYAASDFGEYDEDSPTIWIPKDCSDDLTFGNNGFWLDFEASDNLGNDANGGTDLTEGNLAATDQCTDTPTNNFCTMNPLDNYFQEHVYSEGNTEVLTDSANYSFSTGTVGLTAGKWYWEIEYHATSAAVNADIGIVASIATSATNYLGQSTDAAAYSSRLGEVRKADSDTSGYGDTYAANDIIGVALDLDNSKLYFAKNGTWQNSGDPTSGATGTGAIALTAVGSTANGAYFPAVGDDSGDKTSTFRCIFGGSYADSLSSAVADANGYGAFEYAPPSGYLAICTKNLGSDGG